MKILVLNGKRENSIANAIMESAMYSDIEVISINPLSIKSQDLNNKKRSNWFGVNNSKEDVVSAYERIQLSAYTLFVNSNLLEHLYEYILTNSFDAVICCNSYYVEIMNKLKKNYNYDILCYSIVTDYGNNAIASSMKVDGYFLPHEEFVKELSNDGIEIEKLYTTGIPVTERLAKHKGRLEARKYLCVDPKAHIYLFVCEGFGLDTIEKMYKEILKDDKENNIVYLLVKSTDPLKPKIEKLINGVENVRLIVSSENTNVYIEAADIVISKSNDLFSNQVSVVGVPLIHLEVVPTYESSNDFFVSHEMALKAANIKDAVRKSIKLIKNKALYNRITKIQGSNTYSNSSERIFSIIKKQLTTKKKRQESEL